MAPSKDHSKLYKNNAKPEEARRRRAEHSLELRKQKKEELLMKRRNMHVEEDEEVTEKTESTVPNSSDKPEVAPPKAQTKLTLQEIVAIVTTCQQPTLEQLHTVVMSLRRILSSTQTPPLAEVLDAGLGRVIAQLLTVDDVTTVYEAMWCVTNVMSGSTDHVRHMLDLDVLPLLVRHMQSKNDRISDQAVWAIANVFGDCAEFRDRCIEAGALDVIALIMSRYSELKLDFQRTLAWTLSNVVRHKAPKHCSVEVAQQVVELMKIVFMQNDTTSMRDCLWGLSYVSDATAAHLEMLIKVGLLPALANVLPTKIPELIPPTLRTLGNCCAGDDRHTQEVMATGIFQDRGNKSPLYALYESGSNTVRKEIMWMIGNVLAGTAEQRQYILKNNWLPLILQALIEGDSRTRTEASYCLSNATHTFEDDACLACSKADAASSMAQALSTAKDPRVLLNIADTILAIFGSLKKCDPNEYDRSVRLFEEAEGLDALEQLQSHENEEIYTKMVKIVENHFSEEDEVFNENMNVGAENKTAGTPSTPLTASGQMPLQPTQQQFSF